MSTDIDSIAIQEERKSLDKREIEDEEREKMLNVENKAIEEAEKSDPDKVEVIKPSTDSVTEEGREVKPKFIPIGGIKMPGFFTRSKSKEKCKEGDDGAQGELLEKPATDETIVKDIEEKENDPQKKNKFQSLKIRNPFAKKQNDGNETETSNTEESSNKRNFLNAIRLPLVNMIPRKFRGQSGAGDPEVGLDPAKTAELASMETLDDNKDNEKIEIKNDDGMENVKLDVDDKTDGNTEINKEKLHWRERIRQQKFIIDDLAIAGGILLFIILLIIIISVTASGNKAVVSSPLKNGRYIDAVTSCGLVEGILEDGAYTFRGIPYAVPPVGENRWKPAKPLNRIEACWNGTLKVHNATSTCVQIYGNGTVDGIEDCLTLDVITPHVRYDSPLPVIVLIGSDTLIGGTPGKLRPSTRYARSKDVLFVRPNFRIGVLGFLSLNALSKSSQTKTSGNYGLSDIIVALEWVQLNIKNFGGDPKAVTIFGHRAGATLVTSLLGYEKSSNLFARAWVSSGSGLYPGKPIQEYEEANSKYLDLIKCKDVNCLRDSEIREIIDSVPDTWRSSSPDLPTIDEEGSQNHEWLTLDGFYLKSHLLDVLATTKIPVVIGTTAHESASSKLYFRYTNWTSELVTSHVNKSLIGKLRMMDEVLKLYNTSYQGLASMITDIRTICPLLVLAKQRSDIPFYVVTQTHGDNLLADVDSDISAILGRYEPKTPEQRRYVAAMQQLFYHYVWHGEVPQTSSRKKTLVLDVGQDVLPIKEYPNCDFWISKDFVPRYAHQD